MSKKTKTFNEIYTRKFIRSLIKSDISLQIWAIGFSDIQRLFQRMIWRGASKNMVLVMDKYAFNWLFCTEEFRKGVLNEYPLIKKRATLNMYWMSIYIVDNDDYSWFVSVYDINTDSAIIWYDITINYSWPDVCGFLNDYT